MAYPGGYKYHFGAHTATTEYRDNFADRPKTASGSSRCTGGLGRPASASRLHLIDRSANAVPMFQSVDRRYDDPTPIDWVKPRPQNYLGSPRPKSPAPPRRTKSPCRGPLRPSSPGLRSILKRQPFDTSVSIRDRFPAESYIERRSYPTYELELDSYVPIRPRPEAREWPRPDLELEIREQDPWSSYRSGYGSTGPQTGTGYDRDVSRVGHETWSTTRRYETGYDTVEVITPRPPSTRRPLHYEPGYDTVDVVAPRPPSTRRPLRYEPGYDTVEVVAPRPPSTRRPFTTAVTREPQRLRNTWVDDSPRLLDYRPSHDSATDIALLEYAKERLGMTRKKDSRYPFDHRKY